MPNVLNNWRILNVGKPWCDGQPLPCINVDVDVQCLPELSELRRGVLYLAKTRMRIFLDSSKCACFCHCYSLS